VVKIFWGNFFHKMVSVTELYMGATKRGTHRPPVYQRFLDPFFCATVLDPPLQVRLSCLPDPFLSLNAIIQKKNFVEIFRERVYTFVG
jgi:hypothetical protein